jgi:HEPN domain-containing protein
MRPEDAQAAEAREWLVRAHTDLRAADADLAVSPPLLDDVAFHSQQAVEKSLKAYLAWHNQASAAEGR